MINPLCGFTSWGIKTYDGSPFPFGPSQPVNEIQDQTLRFPCRGCGGQMHWAPERDALECPNCSLTQPVPRAQDEIIERPLEAGATAARGLGVEQRVSACRNCGARITFEGTATTHRCLYCGSSDILEQDANRNLIRPESLVPLEVGREPVKQHFRQWLHQLWFRPNALKKVRSFDADGIYVPYWTFDCGVHSDWSADAGYYYYETERVTVMVNGRREVQERQVRKVRWVPAWGERDDHHDDHPVPASASIPEHLARRLGRFESRGLTAYRPEYLAGWHAEEYQLDLSGGWQRARDDIAAIQRSRCASDVPGDTQRNLQVRNEFADVRWKHVLYPLWSLEYRFRGKVYKVLINGQTGAVAGDAPWSWVKITLAVLVVAAVIGLGAYFAGAR